MGYLMLFIFFGICLLIVWGMLVLLVKKPYVFFTLAISLFVLFELYEYQFHLDHLPNGLHVWKRIYVKEEAWGIGLPGGNETGLILYELPKRASEQIMKDGIDYLKTLKPGNECADEWQETPKLSNPDWFDREDHHDSSPNIEHYLLRYGFYTPMDTNIIDDINQSIASSGSYVSYCRGGGAVIVMPKINKIVFAYSG